MGRLKLPPEKIRKAYFVYRLTARKTSEQETIWRCTKKERKKEKLTVGEMWHKKKERKINGRQHYKKDIYIYLKKGKRWNKKGERSKIGFYFNVVLLFADPIPTAHKTH